MPLKDKVILVTGSTTGIGEAIVQACIAAGAKVMIHGRDEERAQQLCQQFPDKTHYIIADLVDAQARDSIVPATLDHFGRLDGLVNNAGIYPRNNIDELTDELYRKVLAVNQDAPLFLSQQAVKAFRKVGGGAIVNIGSINAHCGQTDLLVYSMTKGALMTMTRNLGDALGRENIRVNQLNVGWTVTESEQKVMKDQGYPEGWEKQLPKVYAPSGQLLRPENIAPHVVFWLSKQSAPANGVVYELEQYPLIGRNLLNTLSF